MEFLVQNTLERWCNLLPAIVCWLSWLRKTFLFVESAFSFIREKLIVNLKMLGSRPQKCFSMLAERVLQGCCESECEDEQCGCV